MRNYIKYGLFLVLTIMLFTIIVYYMKQQPPSIRIVNKEIHRIKKQLDGNPLNVNDKKWIKKKLANMVEIDQLIRSYMDPKNPNKHLISMMKRIDKENSDYLRKILNTYHWITISEFGETADANAITLALHAPIELQKIILNRLEKLPKHETNLNNFATLYDRVAVRLGNPQRYGTQGIITPEGKWQPYEIEEPEKLYERRKSMNMMPYEEYKEKLNQLYNLNK